MEQITIKNFVEKYKSFVNSQMALNYFEKTVEVKKYIPFIQKDAYGRALADATMYEHKDVEQIDGSTKREKTNIVKVNSAAYYLYMVKNIVIGYTNLVSDGNFTEEYDLLHQSGVLQLIMAQIPDEEIKEFKMICDMHKEDALTNYAVPASYIHNQVDHFARLANVTINPILNALSDKLEKVDEKKITSILSKIEKKVSK